MRRLWVKLVALVLAAGVLYVGMTFAQVWLASRQDNAREADAIVVLGAAQYNGRPSDALRGRLDHAAELFEAGMAPKIVVTGGNQPGDRTTEAKASYDYLRQQKGLGDEEVLLEVGSTNTWESLLALENILKGRELDSVVLVSDPYHALRLRGVAGELGIDATVSPTDAEPSWRALFRETAAVSIGRIIGYRRL